jgi:hypothetical protein
MTANRVKPPLWRGANGILGNALARGAATVPVVPAPGGTTAQPAPRAWTVPGHVPVSFTTPRQELHPYDDGH